MAYGLLAEDDYSRMAELDAMDLQWKPQKGRTMRKKEPREKVPTPCRKCGNIQPSYRQAIDHCRGAHRGRPKGLSGKLRIRYAIETAIRNAQVEPCKTEETGV